MLNSFHLINSFLIMDSWKLSQSWLVGTPFSLLRGPFDITPSLKTTLLFFKVGIPKRALYIPSSKPGTCHFSKSRFLFFKKRYLGVACCFDPHSFGALNPSSPNKRSSYNFHLFSVAYTQGILHTSM